MIDDGGVGRTFKLLARNTVKINVNRIFKNTLTRCKRGSIPVV